MDRAKQLGLWFILALITIGSAEGQIPSEIAEVRGEIATSSHVWTAENFGWFFYDLKEGMGGESLHVVLSDRTVEKGRLIYSSRAVAKRFEYEDWGSYLWIGFLGKRYLAGYPDGPLTKDVSSLDKGELREILLDADDRYTISSKKPLLLRNGYSISLKGVSDDSKKVFLELLKDGSSLEYAVVEEDGTYVWKLPGTDVPALMIHFRTAMHGREEDKADIDGVFQVSDSPSLILTDDWKIGLLKVNEVSRDYIELRNDEDIALSPDSFVHLAGGLAIRVMDGPLRYYPVGIYSDYGRYMLRGPIIEEDAPEIHNIIENIPAYVTTVWDYSNYAGFYFDDEDMIGTETFVMNGSVRRVVPAFGPIVPVHMNGMKVGQMRGMLYYSYIQPKRFEREAWGEYNVISLFGQLWFVGYGKNTSSEIGSKSMFDYERLGKVLIDTDAHDIATSGNIYFFNDGYSLLVRDVGKDRIFVSLLKNGVIVDNSTVSSNSTYVYKKDVFDIKDLPVLAVHIGEIFRDGERQIAEIDGVFQISDQLYLPIEGGSKIGELVMYTTPKGIYMVNDESKSLGKGSSVEIWPEYPGITRGLYLAIADNNTLRYFPYTLAYVVPKPRILALGVPERSTAPVSFNATIRASEMTGVLAEIIDPQGRTVSIKDITTGISSGDLWRFEWSWNGTVPVINDTVIPDADIRPTGAVLYLNESTPPITVGVFFDQSGRIEKISGNDGRIYYSRGTNISLSTGSKLAFFIWRDGKVVGEKNQTIRGDINALEPHIERVPAMPGNYVVRLRVSNIVGEAVASSTFEMQPLIYGNYGIPAPPVYGNKSTNDSEPDSTEPAERKEDTMSEGARESPAAGLIPSMIAILVFYKFISIGRRGLRRT